MTSFRLAGLLARTRALHLALLPLLVATLLTTLSMSALRTGELDDAQRIEAEFGQADGRKPIEKAISPGTPTPPAPDIRTGRSIAALVYSPSFRDADQPTSTIVQEEPWPSFSSEGRYTLLEGRWPEQPGEVAVTPALGWNIGQEVTSVPEGLTVTVVGTAEAIYATDQDIVLAAPGTWAGWDITTERAEVANLRAELTFVWLSTDPEATAAALDKAYPADSPGYTATTREEALAATSGLSAQETLQRDLPALLVCILGALASGLLIIRFLRRNLDGLSRAGVSRTTLRLTALALSVSSTAATVIAAYAGALLLAGAMRPLLATRLTHPPRPWEWISEQVATLLVISFLLTALVGSLALPRTAPAQQRAGRTARSASRVAPALTAVALTAAVVLSAAPTGNLWQFVGIIALSALGAFGLAVVLIRLVARRAPREVGATLAGRRLLQRRSAELGLMAGLLAAVVTVLATTLAVAAGTTAQLNKISGTGFPPGMAAFNSWTLPQEAAETWKETFESDLAIDPATGVNLIEHVTPSEQAAHRTWHLASVDDTEKLFGPLTAPQRHALETSQLTTAAEGSPAEPDQLTLPWDLRGITAITLEEAPPPEHDSAWPQQTMTVYTGLTPDQDALAAGWAEANGITPVVITATSRGGEVPTPLLPQLAAVLFGGIVMLLIALTLRGEVRAYGDLMTIFRSLGLGRPWITRVGTELGLWMGIGALAAGVTCSLLAILLCARALGGALLLSGVPWLAIMLLALSGVVGAAAGGAQAARRAATTAT